jgi:hypothetical protein
MLDQDDFRIYKAQLARRYSRTSRCIDQWIAKQLLPRPLRDEARRPYWWASTIAIHESTAGFMRAPRSSNTASDAGTQPPSGSACSSKGGN